MNKLIAKNQDFAELGRQLAKTAADCQSAMQVVVNSFQVKQQELEAAAKSIYLPVENIGKAFESAFAPLGEQVKALQTSFKPLLESLSQSFEKLPPQIRDALMTLADNGWYASPDLSIPAMFRLAEAFTPENVAAANEALCDYFEGELDAVESHLVSQLPERSRLFAAAFAAHRRSEYALSIPVFLAQADGICQKITGEQLYSKDRSGTPKLADLLITPDTPFFTKSMLAPIIEPAPITANARARQQLPDNILNRHAVLHGESSDYDTRLNSCRSISLLIYVAWILHEKS